MLTHDTTISQGEIYINGMSCFDEPTMVSHLDDYSLIDDALITIQLICFPVQEPIRILSPN